MNQSEHKQFDCLTKALNDPSMPRFVLLAKDPLAPKCVRDWGARKMAQMDNEPDPERQRRGRLKAAQAYEVAGSMEAWRALQDAGEIDSVFLRLPFVEEIERGCHFLTKTWTGGVVTGIVIGAAATLATFALWVTR